MFRRSLHAFLCFCLSVSIAASAAAQSNDRPEMFDFRGQEVANLETRVQATSRQKVVVLARGYDQAFLQEVYFGMRDLSGRGIPLVFVVADSETEGNLTLTIFVDGKRTGEPFAHRIGTAPPDNTRAIWRSRVLAAHNELQSIVAARAERERAEREFLATDLDHGIKMTIGEWQSTCAGFSDPANIAKYEEAIRRKEGVSRAEAASRVENLRLLCSGASKKIDWLRRERGLDR